MYVYLNKFEAKCKIVAILFVLILELHNYETTFALNVNHNGVGRIIQVDKGNWIASSSLDVKKRNHKMGELRRVNDQGMFLLNMIDRYHM